MQNKDSRNRLWLATLLLCALIALFFGSHRQWHNLAMYGMIHADAQGYYGYLIAIFIEHSFDWQQVIDGYSLTYFNGGGADFTVLSDAGRVNKYYAGTALLILPFFLMSCLAAFLMGQPVDGYSVPFHIGVMMGALFYALAGLYLLGRYLRSKGLSWAAISISTLGAFAGTGIFFYTVMEPAMSHVYSFFLFCAFIYLADKAIAHTSGRNLLFLAVVLAIIALVRPTNAVIVFSLPFIAGGWGPFIQFLQTVFADFRRWSLPLLVAICIALVQPLMYVFQVGRPFVWSYSGEGFNFADPQIINVLFSYQKGLFVYYPWTFLASFGLIALFIRNKAAAIWLSVFLGVSIYIISSWWCWYYGGSFGMRAMVEFIPFFILLMAYLVDGVPAWAKWVLGILSMLAIPLNLVQTYQYNKFILHWASMDKERYWHIFLKTDKKYEGLYFRETKTIPLPPDDQIEARFKISTDLEYETLQWGTQGRQIGKAHSGQWVSKLDAQNQYGTTTGILYNDMGPEGRKLLVATFMAYSEEEMPALTLAYSFSQGERHYGHAYLGCGDQLLEKNTWTAVRLVVELPTPENPTDTWVVYPYTTGEATILVDDISYELLTLKE